MFQLLCKGFTPRNTCPHYLANRVTFKNFAFALTCKISGSNGSILNLQGLFLPHAQCS